jgi:hypothetical protein
MTSGATYSMEEYLNSGPSGAPPQYILLLTDDQNTISEAELNFLLPVSLDVFWTAPVTAGPADGRFENQIPSDDPVRDVGVLLAEIALVQHFARLFVHTSEHL